jgi:hypothetical protein
MSILCADRIGEEPRSAEPGLVLVTDGDQGQGRSAIAAVRALAAGGCAGRRDGLGQVRPRVEVAVLPAAGRDATGVVTGLRDAVRAELGSGEYLGVMPASDAALVALGCPGASFLDKVELGAARACCRPPTVPAEVFPSADRLRERGGELTFPVVVKPAGVEVGRPKLAAVRLDDARDLTSLPADSGRLLVQPVVAGPMMAVAGVVWGGRLVAAVHQRYERTWPVACGTASSAVTIEPDVELERRLTRLLRGFDGIFQAQFVGGRLIDLNPRVYGSLPLAVAASVNLPAIVCTLASGTSGASHPEVRGRAGVRYRWLEGDLRHLIHAVRHRSLAPSEALAALRPRLGTAHSVTSLRDPGPVVARLAYASSRGRR